MQEKSQSALRLIVAGDTHGKIKGLEQELKKLSFDHLLFTGDFYSDAVRMANHLKISYDAVLGNCDPCDKKQPKRKEEKILQFCGWSFLMVHGHQYGVKSSLNSLYYRALELNVRAVIFGHTHVPLCEDREGIWLINPGSPSRPRGLTPGNSYIILDINPNSISPRLVIFS